MPASSPWRSVLPPSSEQWPPLLAGAAAATGVLAACLAVLATRPAATFLAAIGEVVLALLLATLGALGVASFSVRLEVERFAYLVISVAFLATVALVYRLAGGLHSLGRRGLVLAAGATVLLLVVLVYTAALTRYGSPELVLQVRSAQEWVRDQLGGVPHSVEALVGIPALVWGVSMRSRRRQGWWVCAFGATATAAGDPSAAGGRRVLAGGGPRGGVHPGPRPAARLRADQAGAAAHRQARSTYGARSTGCPSAARNPAGCKPLH